MIFGILHGENLLLKIRGKHVLTWLRNFTQNIRILRDEFIDHFRVANVNDGLIENLPNGHFVVLLNVALLVRPFVYVFKNIFIRKHPWNVSKRLFLLKFNDTLEASDEPFVRLRQNMCALFLVELQVLMHEVDPRVEQIDYGESERESSDLNHLSNRILIFIIF